MQAIITVFRAEFEGKDDVKSRVSELTEDLKIVGDAYIFSPRPGKLFDLLNILRNNRITYGTHFNNVQSEKLKD
jgi:hypothetical protein